MLQRADSARIEQYAVNQSSDSVDLRGITLMLKWNAAKVNNLTGTEIWFMIIACALIGFGLGVLAARYFPQVAAMLGIPALVFGGILFLIAAKGLFRTAKGTAD